ncbi:hypothetical protein JNUCC0626_04380 [Lentzea sp. JNUCC 0626]|uniref:hypothetical protein n=1 Tax=Lentzea sp. JNUCC 0626 TaxID=3367513 RepID=UPI003747C346
MMDERTDPTLIIAQPGGLAPPRQRIVEVWAHLAAKAGWQVEPVADFELTTKQDCGAVDVEGLRYVVKYGPRLREPLYEGNSERPVFAPAAWVEPLVAASDRALWPDLVK